MLSVRLASLLLLFALLLPTARAAAPAPSEVQFKNWYPGIRGYMEYNLNHQCAENFTNYYNTSYPFDDCAQCRGQALIDCLLNNLDQITSANVASAAVILGLLPSILSYVGLSYVETGILAQRRPILALLLAAGSPAVSPIRSFDYRDPAAILEVHPGSIARREPTQSRAIFFAVLQYIAASAAIVNLVVVTWQLCIRTICNFATNIVWMPVLWPLLAILIHIVAILAVRLKVRFHSKPNTTSSAGRMSSALYRELTLCIKHPRTMLETREESTAFLIIAWIVSTGTVLHIVLGTLVFSSLLFITTQDAITVAVQYLASTLVCKMVLVYELAGLREKVGEKVDEDDKSQIALLKRTGDS